MTDHDPDQDDALKELDAALQVEPSRAFADGVRARVNRSKSNTRRMWWGLAAAACLGLATMTLWRPSADAPAMVAVAPTQVSAPAPATTSPSVVAANKAPTPEVPVRPVSVRHAPQVARVAVTTESEPRLEVITNQGGVLRELWAAGGTGAMVETAFEAPIPVTPAEVKPIAPIVLDPIVVTPIVVTEIGKGSGREGATPVIRRVDAAKETR